VRVPREDRFAAGFFAEGFRAAGFFREGALDETAFFASLAIVAASFSTFFDSAASFFWIAESCFCRAAEALVRFLPEARPGISAIALSMIVSSAIASS
jgi:hypothetical protein